MRIEVISVDGPDLDENIFIYQRVASSPYSQETPNDMFCAVAGPADIASIPPEEPNTNQRWPFYRLNWVELDFPSTRQAMQTWEEIKREVKVLAQAMTRFSNLIAVETFDTDS
jgi:hypothetical protein